MRVLREWPLGIGGGLIIVGILLGSLLGAAALQVSLVVLALSATAATILSATSPQRWLAVPLCFLLLGIGGAYAGWIAQQYPFVAHEAELVEVPAVVRAPLEAKGFTAQTELALEHENQEFLVRADVLVPANVTYGDRVLVSGQLEAPSTDPGRTPLALRAQGLSGTAAIDQLIVEGGSPSIDPVQTLYQFREWLLERLASVVAQPERSVIAGVLLGSQEGLSKEVIELFRQTGTAHILVASGSNLAILAAIVRQLAWPLGRRRSAWLAMAPLLAFVIITGGDPSIVRAGILFGLMLIAELSGRRVHLPTLFVAIVLMMMLAQPWIWANIAFQLSFGAVLGLAVFSEWIFDRLPGPRWVAALLAPTLAAQLGTWPILVFHFGQVSLIAPLANLFVEPIVPVLMTGGLLTLLAPWLVIFPWATAGLADLLVRGVTLFGQLPWASVAVPAHHMGWSVAAVASVVFITWLRYRPASSEVRHGR